MSNEQEIPDHIADEAALWLVEADEGLSPERQREFARWQRADARHAAAVQRLQWGQSQLHRLPEMDDSLLPPYSPPGRPEAPPRVRFPRAAAWTLGLAAAVALAALGWWNRPVVDAVGAVYTCEAGGYQRAVLPDGSQLELNGGSRVEVRFSPSLRRVQLDAGTAHFTVAKDAARPFVVEAGGVAVRAVGTAFLVRREAAAVDVLVTEGRVAIFEADHPGQAVVAPSGRLDVGRIVEVAAGERTRVDGTVTWTAGTRPRVEKIGLQAARQALEWRERKLVFDDVPLRDVVREFNQRNRLQLVIQDHELAGLPVGGTFAADNVEGLIRLLEDSGTVRSERRGEWEVVLRSRAGARP